MAVFHIYFVVEKIQMKFQIKNFGEKLIFLSKKKYISWYQKEINLSKSNEVFKK